MKTLIDYLSEYQFIKSESQYRRFIETGSIIVDGEVINDYEAKLSQGIHNIQVGNWSPITIQIIK